jgi:hypothetical protein
METDADRLECIKALGGQLVHLKVGEFWAIFDSEGVQVSFDEVHINSSSPQITMRASDADAFELARGVPIELDKLYTIREKLPAPAPGWAAFALDSD